MGGMMVDYTCAAAVHETGFLALQAKNLLTNIPQEQQAGGFVTTPFTAAQFHEMIAEEGVFVALHDEEVIGYVVCASWRYLSQYPIFVHMVSLFPSISSYPDKITETNSYQYGPVCIDHAWRGKEVFSALFAFAREKMQKKYPYALTFVNSRNHRSREAHQRKLGLDYIQDFAFNNNQYHMFGFSTGYTHRI
jgi:hypothetical protein